MLTRMRAVAGLIGIASGFADSAHISVAGWLIEGLADEALERLTDAIRLLPSGATERPRRPGAQRSRTAR